METASYKKEMLEKKKAEIHREKLNQQTNSNAIEAMNNRVTDSIERGFQPHWVLEETASHLALKAIETEDDKWLEMISYLRTQKNDNLPTSDLRKIGPNNYGNTLKGKNIIIDAMQKIRAKQNKREKTSIAEYNYRQKEIELELKKQASTLYYNKDGSQQWNEKWQALIAYATRLGKAGIVKGEKENIENLRKDFKSATDGEVQELVTGFLKRTSTQDLFDTNFNFLFTESGIVLTEKQEGDLKDRIENLRGYENIKEVKEAIDDSSTLIDEILEAEKAEQYPHVTTWGVSHELNQAVREQKRLVKEQIKNVYIDHLEKQRKELGKPLPYKHWAPNAKKDFLQDVSETLSEVLPKQNKDGSFGGLIYNNIISTFRNNPPPILERDKAIRIKYLNSLRSDFEGVIATGGNLTATEQAQLDEINLELKIIDLKGEQIRLEEKEKYKKITETSLVTSSGKTKKEEDIRTKLQGVLINAATSDKSSGSYDIDEFIRDKKIRLGDQLKEKVKAWKENITPASETQVSKDMSRWYEGKLSSYFPGFYPGFLDGALRFDIERKLERVPEGAVNLVHDATRKARELIEDRIATEVKVQEKPYGLWSSKVKREFTKETEVELKKQVFNKLHLATLKEMMPKDTLDMTPQALLLDLDGVPIAQLKGEEVEKYHSMYLPKDNESKTRQQKAIALGEFIKPYMNKRK